MDTLLDTPRHFANMKILSGYIAGYTKTHKKTPPKRGLVDLLRMIKLASSSAEDWRAPWEQKEPGVCPGTSD
jgi:hypothetical protein